METVDVKFIGGGMTGITLTMETNEFQDGDLLNFHGDSYLMKSERGYFVKPASAPATGDNFKGTSGHFKNVGGHLKDIPLA